MNEKRILMLDVCEGSMHTFVIVCDAKERNKPIFVVEEEDWKELIKDYYDIKEMVK